jgi:hypothetical protein
MGDCQARFCERLGLKCPCLLDLGWRKKSLGNHTLVYTSHGNGFLAKAKITSPIVKVNKLKTQTQYPISKLMILSIRPLPVMVIPVNVRNENAKKVEIMLT